MPVDPPVDLVANLQEATVSFEQRRVLGPLSFSINPGDHWAVLGPNGCGKTTLLTLLGAERHPTTGSVEVLGERLGSTDMRRLRRRIGFVGHAIADQLPLHARSLEIVLTGKDALLAPWWSTFDDADRQRALELLERFHCAHVADQLFGYCSQGERQRVLLARAMYREHPLLLLDEPANGVDLPGREALVSSLEDLAVSAPALSSMHVAHTLEELPSTLTHALLLREGKPIALGPVRKVLTEEALGECFGLQFRVRFEDGRYSATARGSW